MFKLIYNNDLGDSSSASTVTGATAFDKIATLKSEKVSTNLSTNTIIATSIQSSNSNTASFVHYDGTQQKLFVYIDGNRYYFS